MSRHLLSLKCAVAGATACAWLLLQIQQARGTYIVDSWQIASQIFDFANGQDAIHVFSVVQNPFTDSHSITLQESTADAVYNFGWNESQASFHTAAAHQALDVPPGGLFSRSTGFIFIQPSVDAVLTVSGFYNYALPPDEYFAELFASVRDMDTNQPLWSQSEDADSFGGQFVSGTLNVSGSGILLTGGHTHRLSYEFVVDTFGGGTNAIGTGDGEIQWTLTAVPSPNALCMILMGLLVLGRRPQSWRRGRL